MDYKEAIQEIHEDLCFEFEELHGRAPTQKESLDLYEEAQDKYHSRMEAYGDYLRKQEKGE